MFTSVILKLAKITSKLVTRDLHLSDFKVSGISNEKSPWEDVV